jgi:hypothetical protein
MGRNRALGTPFEIATISTSQTTEPHIDMYAVDEDVGSPVTLTLDPNAFNGDQVVVQDVGDNAGTEAITIQVSPGQTILGVGASVQITTDGGGVRLTFNQELSGWALESFATTASVPTPATVSGMGFAQDQPSYPIELNATTNTLLAEVTVTPQRSGVFLLIATALCDNAQAASGTYDSTFGAHNFALALQDSGAVQFYSRQGSTIIASQTQGQDMQFLTDPYPIGVPVTFQCYGLTDSGGVPPTGGPMLVVACELAAVEMES